MAEENNIGASRLIGTNGLQSAVDSLSTQVNKLTSAVSSLSGSTSRSNGNSAGSAWNAQSNRTGYSGNGGGGGFSSSATFGSNGRGNGGGASYGSRLGSQVGGKLGFTLAASASVASAATSYGNKNMSNMLQENFFGTQAALGGGGTAGNNVAINSVFRNNYGALSVNDAAAGGYINQFTYGNAILNGQSNPLFVAGQRQSNALGYANPTMGSQAAATALQQSYTSRSALMGAALGINTITPTSRGGIKNSMGSIASQIYTRTFGAQKITAAGYSAATAQGGSLAVNLQYLGNQLGWSQSTQQEYQGLIKGQVSAQNNGMSSTSYYNLLNQAGSGNKNAQAQLKKVGVGTSAFEAQRNLNSVTMGNQADINESMATAFTKTTNAVNSLTTAIDNLMKSSGLNRIIGGAAGVASPVSNALGGLSNGFGMATGILGAARLFGGGTGLLGGFGGFGGGAAAASSTGALGGGLTATTAGAGGVYGITSLGTASSVAALPVLGAGIAAIGAGNQAKQSAKNWASKPANSAITKFLSWRMQHLNATKSQTAAERASLNIPAGYGQASSGNNGAGNTAGNNQSSGGATDASVIKFAETQLGVPYVWGGETPGKAMDCSGLTQWAYGKAGVKIPRVASAQQKTGKQVATNATQPGDLLFVGNPAHHVVMSVGGGKVIEAPHTGEKVRIRAFSPSEFDSASRIVGSVGNMGSLGNNSAPNQNTLNNQQNLSGGDIGNFGTSEADVVASALAGSLGGLPMTGQSASAAGTSSSSSLGATPKANGNNSKSALQSYAKALLAKYGWAGQWSSFNALEMSEAGWNPHATNPTSGAYGLAQALPASKYNSAGMDWKTNGDTQLAWMMGYIKDRYGSPDKAWSFHQKNNWYADGAWSIDKDQKATVHQGEMIIPAQQAETIRQTLLNNSFNPNVTKNSSSKGGISFGDINVNLPSTYSGSTGETQQIGKVIVDTMKEQLRLNGLQIGQ